MATETIFSEQEAQELLSRDQDELAQLLALRVNAVQKNISLSLEPTFDVQVSPFEAANLPPWIQETIDAMISMALRQSHKVMCSDEREYADLRAKLTGAMGLGGSAAVLALAAFLTGTLGMVAALATVVATIVIKKIGEPALQAGHHTLCEQLEKLLPR